MFGQRVGPAIRGKIVEDQHVAGAPLHLQTRFHEQSLAAQIAFVQINEGGHCSAIVVLQLVQPVQMGTIFLARAITQQLQRLPLVRIGAGE